MSLIKRVLLTHVTASMFICVGLLLAIIPTILHIVLHPRVYVLNAKPMDIRIASIRRRFFYSSWRYMSSIIDIVDAGIKAPIVHKAHGRVLEVGAGIGNNIKYYDRSQVKQLILVEPNIHMHRLLREKANAAGYFEEDDSLLLLSCGAAEKDEQALASSGVISDSIDSVVCVHVLCSIPQPGAAIELYRRLLRRGGILLFFEHVRSVDSDTAKWQSWYTDVVWRSLFDGCELNRETGELIIHGPSGGDEHMGESSSLCRQHSGYGISSKTRWMEYDLKTPERWDKDGCTPHIMGFAVKA